MMADLIAKGLHVGFHAFIVAATPATWGHAIEVPETRLNCDDLWPFGIPVDVGIHAASMLTPGAAISG